jgi:hypothetical protein
MNGPLYDLSREEPHKSITSLVVPVYDRSLGDIPRISYACDRAVTSASTLKALKSILLVVHQADSKEPFFSGREGIMLIEQF